MKIAIKLNEFTPVPIPYGTEGMTAFKDQQSADEICKRLNDDAVYGRRCWIVEPVERHGQNFWLVVSVSESKAPSRD